MGGGGGIGCGADEEADEEDEEEAAAFKGVELLLISFSPVGRHSGKVKTFSAAPLMFLQQPVASRRPAVSHAGSIDQWWVAIHCLVLDSSNIFIVFFCALRAEQKQKAKVRAGLLVSSEAAPEPTTFINT